LQVNMHLVPTNNAENFAFGPDVLPIPAPVTYALKL